jgi:hypothetical protein
MEDVDEITADGIEWAIRELNGQPLDARRAAEHLRLELTRLLEVIEHLVVAASKLEGKHLDFGLLREQCGALFDDHLGEDPMAKRCDDVGQQWIDALRSGVGPGRSVVGMPGEQKAEDPG